MMGMMQTLKVLPQCGESLLRAGQIAALKRALKCLEIVRDLTALSCWTGVARRLGAVLRILLQRSKGTLCSGKIP